MDKSVRTTATNLAFDGMLAAEKQMEMLPPEQKRTPIFVMMKMIYDLFWIVYQLLLEERKRSKEVK